MTRPFIRHLLAFCLCIGLPLSSLALSNALFASPYLPADQINLKLSPEAKGKLLLSELNCAACHEDKSASLNAETHTGRQGPDLNFVSDRLRLDYIEKMLLDPAKMKPGTLMPDVLGRLAPEKKKEVAAAIAHYLSASSLNKETSEKALHGNAKRGDALYHSVGCAACHPPLKAQSGQKQPMGLAHLHEKYSPDGLQRFLFDPLKHRPAGRMPDMKLTRQEAADLASYLMSFEKVQKPKKLVKNKPQYAKGKAYFMQFNCAACHQRDNVKASPAKPLKALATLTSARCGGPVYDLSGAQASAITAALQSEKPIKQDEQLKLKLATFNCYACHERDGLGGITDDHPKMKWFKTSEVELGNAGKIPPPLTGVGAKLQRRWMHKVLYEGESLRTYMQTRMPQFGQSNLHGLIDLFEAEDKIEPSDMMTIKIEGKMRRTYRDAGRKLVGTDGNSCIACHQYNGHDSLGLKAFDLVATAERLKPDWFYHYMINPNRFRPGIVMPSFWPNGQSLHKDILDGDTNKQLRAMWHYFTFGQTQGLPKGLKVEPSSIIAKDKVMIYRGRSRVAGFRGIAIGFPEKINLAFDAEMMNVTSIWPGEFVNVNWRGQAAGDFSPSERSIRINASIPFANLEDDQAPWPTRQKKGDPSKDKDNTNMDPLFVKRHGYQFKGYYLNQDGLPVLTYMYQNIQVLDHWQVKAGQLHRTLSFESPAAKSFFMRLLVGEIQVVDNAKHHYQLGKLHIKAPMSATVIGQDLRMKIEAPKGQRQVTIIYEVMP